jgi:hypothetical protein
MTYTVDGTFGVSRQGDDYYTMHIIGRSVCGHNVTALNIKIILLRHRPAQWADDTLMDQCKKKTLYFSEN